MSEDFTLYRGESGSPHCVAFRCAHRGTQLSTGWVEGDELRCFYHGWKYDVDGRCVDLPTMPPEVIDALTKDVQKNLPSRTRDIRRGIIEAGQETEAAEFGRPHGHDD